MIKYFLALSLLGINVHAQTTDCSEAYGTPTSCEKVDCPESFQKYTGVWRGPFESYDQNLKRFRPFQNETSYDTHCLRNSANQDLLVIGRRKDTYPEFLGSAATVKEGLLIMGWHQGEMTKPFMRSLDADGRADYVLVFHNQAAELSVWQLDIPSPKMTFTVVDARDFTVGDRHKRLVTVFLKTGGQEFPIVKGQHTRD